jgi:hypothetical protein
MTSLVIKPVDVDDAGDASIRITYDIFRTFDLSIVCGGWYKREERGL